jgi:site-specific recombinase XerD
MLDLMIQRGYSEQTHKAYLRAVTDLARYFRTPPDQLKVEQLQEYFNELVSKRHLSSSSCRQALNGIRFLYLQVLHWAHFDVHIDIPKRPQKLPELLTRSEIEQIILACRNGKHRMLLMTCYGCGLRVSELVRLKVKHIDGERHLLRIERGKGNKDRCVLIAESLLGELRQYWRQYQPALWLFPNNLHPQAHLCVSSAQRIYNAAKRRAGIDKQGGIHSLRHAYATHQLDQGLPVNQLQQQLGHRDLKSTLRYLHWVPGYQQGKQVFGDLIGELDV